MARPCDCGTCQEKGVLVALFTDHIGERATRAACSEDHQALLDKELKARGFKPEWGPLLTNKPAPEEEAGNA